MANDDLQDTELPPAKKPKLKTSTPESDSARTDFTDDVMDVGTKEFTVDEDKYRNFVTPEELEKLREFKVLDEVKSNDEEDSNDEDSESSDGKSVDDAEIEKMLEENLPEDFKGAPKQKEKSYFIRQKILLEEKGINHFEVLPLDWMMIHHHSGMPIYMHRSTRVCTLSKPYFLGKGNARRHDIPISAVPCLSYRKALEEEDKQKEIDKRIEEQIRIHKLATNNKNMYNEKSFVNTALNFTDTNDSNKINDTAVSDKEAISDNNINKKGSSSGGEEKCPFKHNKGKKFKTNNSVTDAIDVTMENICDNGDNVHMKSFDDKEKSVSVNSKSTLKNNIFVNKENMRDENQCNDAFESEINQAVASSSNVKIINQDSNYYMKNIKKENEVLIQDDYGKSSIENITEVSLEDDMNSVNETVEDNIKEEVLSVDLDISEVYNDETDNTETIVDENQENLTIGHSAIESDKAVSEVVENASHHDGEGEKGNDEVETENDEAGTGNNEAEEGNGEAEKGNDKAEKANVEADETNGENGENVQESTDREVPENNEGNADTETGKDYFDDIPIGRRPVTLPGGMIMAPPRVETVSTSWKTQLLTPEQINDYCKKLFKFKVINIMHFKRWADRRKYNKARKRMQFPTLSEGSTLITIPVQHNSQQNGGRATKRDWVMNMNGSSYLSVFHEYVVRALHKQPVYEFKQLENASTPYQATVYIGGMQYGVGHGSSKRMAKAAAARASVHILIPEMKHEMDAHHASASASTSARAGAGAHDAEPDFSFFDYVGIEDPRVGEFCAATCEPSPHAILKTCLLRNFGAGERHIHQEMKKLEYQEIELTMKVGKHTATVVCKNKKIAKQRASQKILQALHPHVRSWGSLLRLYGSRSVKSCKEKKQEEQQITLLQDKAKHNEPNYAVLEKLRNEMRKLAERDAAVAPIGTFLLADNLPTHSDSNLNNVEL